ncbi:MAG: ABC transporter permease subunit [bacterium]|nr:ABC transporter permease subunit [bacterium]
MFKKEFNDILKPTLLRLIPLFIYPVLLLLSTFNIGLGGEYQSGDLYIVFIFVFMAQVVWIAGNYGLNIFSGEYRDNAMEYLFSFPFSKGRIIYYKLMPRLLVLLGLHVVYSVMILLKLVEISEDGKALDGLQTFAYLGVPLLLGLTFLFSGFFSSLLEDKQKRLALGVVVFLSILLNTSTGAVLATPYGRHRLAIGFVAACLLNLAIMAVAYFSTYRKWDPSRLPIYGRKFRMRYLIPVALLDLGCILHILYRLGTF